MGKTGNRARRAVAAIVVTVVTALVMATAVLIDSDRATAATATRSTGCATVNGAVVTDVTSTTFTGEFAVGEKMEFTITGTPISGTTTSPGSKVDFQQNSSYFPVSVTTAGTWTIEMRSDHKFSVSATCKLPQTITFESPPSVAVGETITIKASAPSGSVTARAISPGICSVSGLQVTGLKVGGCEIFLVAAADSLYSDTSKYLGAIPVVKASQTITFDPLSDRTLGDLPFTIAAKASSGLAVTFSSDTTAVCTVSGSTVSMVLPGTCTIVASQAGNDDYDAAPDVSRSFTVGKRTQTITFGALADRTLDLGDVTVSATASSGLTVAFSSDTTAVCTVSGTTVTPFAAGTCTIRASQAGNDTYEAATPVTRSFTASKAAQTITFDTPADRAFGPTPFTVSATATSGLPVSFASDTPSVCTVSGSSVTLVATGTCTITASQVGNGTYEAATAVARSFDVSKGAQTITFAALADRPIGTAPFTVSATSTSGLAVSFASDTPSVCTVSGTTVTLLTIGTCTITASQAGNTNYEAATPVRRSFAVGYTIARLAPPAKTKVRSGSTLPVKFQLTTAGGTPISAATAATFRCPTSPTAPAATVTLAGGAPVCATYDARTGVFQANVRTTGVAAGDQSLVVAVTLGTTTLATRTATIQITG